MLNQIIQLFCWAPKWLWLGLLTKPQSGSIHVILPFLCAENSTYFNSYKLAKINHFITQWYLGGYTRVDKLAYLQFFSFLIDLSNSFYHTHWCGDICYIGELENKTSDPGSMCFTSGTSNICTKATRTGILHDTTTLIGMLVLLSNYTHSFGCHSLLSKCTCTIMRQVHRERYNS